MMGTHCTFVEKKKDRGRMRVRAGGREREN